MFPWLGNEELRSLRFRNTANRSYPGNGTIHFVRKIYRLEQDSGKTPFTGKKSPDGTLLAEPYFQHQVVYVSIPVAHTWRLLAKDIKARKWGAAFKRALMKLFDPLCTGRIETADEYITQHPCGKRKIFVNLFRPGSKGAPFSTDYNIICHTKDGRLNFESIKLLYPECSYIDAIQNNPLEGSIREFYMPTDNQLRYVFQPIGVMPVKMKLTASGGRKLIGGWIKPSKPTESDEESETEAMERQRREDEERDRKEQPDPNE